MQLQQPQPMLVVIFDNHKHPLLLDELLNDSIDDLLHLVTLLLVVDHTRIESHAQQVVC